MSRKQELLNLMNIDVSWMKNISHEEVNHSSFDDLELESKYCNKCTLSETRNNVVFGKGSLDAKILIIGEAPGKDEDQTGQPFIGRAGKLLNEILFSMKVTREEVYITNTVKCRPPDNRNPSNDEIKSCSGFLDNQINHISPKIIILLGKVAAESIMNTSETMTSLRGKVHFYKDTEIPMLVFYHPAYLLRSPSEKRKVWDDILFMKSVTDGC
tara:strand:- start:3528 stop:4166 length:639 start_codon:yes stop_codon:yes gene_type:complete